MTDGVTRRLHMGCGESLCGHFPLRDKSQTVTPHTAGTILKQPGRMPQPRRKRA